MPVSPPFQNAFLNHLSESDLGLLLSQLEPVDLPLRYRLADAGQPITMIYFLESGIASTTASVRHEMAVEIGLTGREGVVNLPALLGTDRTPGSTYMQLAGDGLRIDVDNMRRAMENSASLTSLLLRCTHVFMVQTASTALANARATVTERLARWLLMARDRTGADAVPLTHEFIATMLGVRRSGVSVAMQDLERAGMIRGGRGMIAILDRQGLEEQANGYYGVAEAEMRRLFGNPDRSR